MIKESLESKPVVTGVAAVSGPAFALLSIAIAFSGNPLAAEPGTMPFYVWIAWFGAFCLFGGALIFLALMRWAKDEPMSSAKRIEAATVDELRVLLSFNGARRAKLHSNMTVRTLRDAGLVVFKIRFKDREPQNEYELTEEAFQYLRKHRAELEARATKAE